MRTRSDASPLQTLCAEIERLRAEREEWRARPVPDEAFDEITERIGDLYWRFVDTPAGSPTEAVFKLNIMLTDPSGISADGYLNLQHHAALVQIADVLGPAAQIAEAAVKNQAAAALAEAKRTGGVS